MATAINPGNDGQDALPAPKQIRFVNNQGQPPTKRRRIISACLTCRKRKTRCAGEHPTCSTCTKNGHVCLGYNDAPPDKRRDGNGADGLQPEAEDDDCTEEDPEPDRKLGKGTKPGTKVTTTDLSDQASVSQSQSQPASASTSTYATPKASLKKESSDDTQRSPTQTHSYRAGQMRRPTVARHASFSTEDGHSSSSRSSAPHGNESGLRVPYFRYFGPTAIVPGFKEMVVKLRERRRSSLSTTTSPSNVSVSLGYMNSALQDLDDMPLYDPNDPAPVHALITSLVDTFFRHLGSNYPFLRRDRFPRMVEEKRAEPILVNAVCALAARFSDVPVFKKWNDGKLAKSEYGNVYSQRAKCAVVDTFPCPSVAAVQACLLMAYDGFGADQDSALWMYLGIAIRMAVDLGLTKEDGVRYQGSKDPYARSLNRKADNEEAVLDDNVAVASQSEHDDAEGSAREVLGPAEQKAVEQERIDTLWAVFFLDRVISSGTGRPVTLKDDDYELELPKFSIIPNFGWPDPMPVLYQIVHLYGRVSDVLNKIGQASDLTQDKLHRLAAMEAELTRLHQKTNQRLRFDANNFQAYVKNGQGTTFILLHFWFHALIIVLHQPTLLTRHGRVSRRSQLKPHSRELSMSSAKTIADILAFAELLDPKCFIGNPFTSQPIYIAANAFLMESVANATHPDSPHATHAVDPRPPRPEDRHSKGGLSADSKSASRHLLLASAANQNYQACYKALKQMQAYWGGVRYILTALDQKSEGIWDCETYTDDEYQRTQKPRQDSVAARAVGGGEHPESPGPPGQDNGPPLAWSLTGTTNSPNSSLTLLFQNPVASGAPPPPPPPPHSTPTPPGNMIYDPIRQSLPESSAMYPPASPYPQPATSALRHSMNSPQRRASHPAGRAPGGAPSDETSKSPSSSEARLPLGAPPHGAMSTAYSPHSQQAAGFGMPAGATTSNAMTGNSASSAAALGMGAVYPPGTESGSFVPGGSGLASGGYSFMNQPGSNLHLLTYDNETDIGQHLTSFEQSEMISWFGDYFPNDLAFYPDPNLG